MGIFLFVFLPLVFIIGYLFMYEFLSQMVPEIDQIHHFGPSLSKSINVVREILHINLVIPLRSVNNSISLYVGPTNPMKW